jgi:hypothetical protein
MMDENYNLNGGFKPTMKRFADLDGPDFFPTPAWAAYALVIRSDSRATYVITPAGLLGIDDYVSTACKLQTSSISLQDGPATPFTGHFRALATKATRLQSPRGPLIAD